jgi:hypothetical protein
MVELEAILEHERLVRERSRYFLVVGLLLVAIAAAVLAL